MKVCTLLLLATHASLASPTPGRALIVDQGGRIRNDKPSASLFGLRKIGGALHRSLAGQLDVIFNRNKKTKRERIQHSLSSISVVLIGWGVGQHACRTASETPKLLGHLKHVNVLPLCAAQRLVAIELQHSPDMQSIPGAVVEFATEADAAACAGQRELKGMAVELTVRHNTPFKRTRDGDDGSGGSRRRGSEDKERRLNRVGLSYTCGICGKLGSGFLSEKITARYTMVVLLAMQMGAMLLFLLGSPNRLAVWTVRRRPLPLYLICFLCSGVSRLCSPSSPALTASE